MYLALKQTPGRDMKQISENPQTTIISAESQ